MAADMTRIKLKFVHVFRDRHGRVRHYFRRSGKRTPLPGLPGSAEFMAAYEMALASLTAQREIGASRTRPGTVNAAVVGYYQSLNFRELAPGTQRMRRGILERFRTECGDFRIATMPQKFIAQRLSRMGPGAARNWRKALHALLEFAVAEGFREDNPVTGVKLPKAQDRRPSRLDRCRDRAISGALSDWHSAAVGVPIIVGHSAAPIGCGPHGAAARAR
jgi:hypothetical protein